MLFSCPKCMREEEVIGHRDPRCTECDVAMLPPSDYSQVFMSPFVTIVRMNELSKRCGVDRARTDGRFKREREAFAAGVLALALSKLKDELWWVQVETVDATPDTRLWRFEETATGNVLWTINIESVDWDENVEDVMMVIKKKCERRFYPHHFRLLVHARNFKKEIDFERVVEEMIGVQSPFAEVWVFAIRWPDREFKVVRVSPALPAIDLKISDLENASKQRQFVQRGSRGVQAGLQEVGQVFLPLPKCN